MTSNVVDLHAPPKVGHVEGERGHLTFKVTYRIGRQTKGECGTCGGRTLRTRYGILHADCYGCRYLKMIYGDTIKVRREK